MRVIAHSLDELDTLRAEFDPLVERALTLAVNNVAANLSTRALTAGAEEDAFAVVHSWETQVDETLLPHIAAVFDGASLSVAYQLADGVTLGEGSGIPMVPPDPAVAYLSQARNRLAGVGDDVWNKVRDQLVAGVQAGESIEQLAVRVQTAGQLALPRARTIARTEVNGASNAGAYAQLAYLGMAGMQEWLATDDARTREDHALADGQKVPLDGAFTVGGWTLKWPGDPSAPASETVNCRCTVAFDLTDDPPSVTCDALAVTAALGKFGSAGAPKVVATSNCVVPPGSVPAHPDADKVAELTDVDKQYVYKTFMYPKQISPAYGGAKIHKQVQSTMDALEKTGKPHLATLGPQDIVHVIDQQYKQGKYTFKQKYDEWLGSKGGVAEAPHQAVTVEPKPMTTGDIMNEIKNSSVPVGHVYAEGVDSDGVKWHVVRRELSDGKILTVLEKNVSGTWITFNAVNSLKDLLPATSAGTKWTVPGETTVKADPVPGKTATVEAGATDTGAKVADVTSTTPPAAPTPVTPIIKPTPVVDDSTPAPVKTDKGHVPLTQQAGDISAIPELDQEAFYQAFKKQKVTAVWSGNKIWDALQKTKASGFAFNDLEALKILDKKFTEHGGSTGFVDKMVKWEQSPAGKKVLGDVPVGVKVTPSSTMTDTATKAGVAPTEPHTFKSVDEIKEFGKTQPKNEPFAYGTHVDDPDWKFRAYYDDAGVIHVEVQPSYQKGSDKWNPVSDAYANQYLGDAKIVWKSASGAVVMPGPKPTAPKVDVTVVPTSLKKQMLTELNSAGPLLTKPPATIYKKIVEIREYAKTQGHSLSDLEVLRILDAEKAAQLGVPNAFLYEKKIVEWLKTPSGKAAAKKYAAGIPKTTYTPPPSTGGYTTPSYGAPKVTREELNAEVTSTVAEMRAKISTTDTHFPVISPTEATAFKAEMDKASKGWTADQRAGLRHYTGSNYTQMNGFLRGKTDFISEPNLTATRNAQAGMRPSTRPIVVHRGTGFSQFGGTHVDPAIVGKVFKDEGFMSTSVGGSAAFGGQVLLEIECPTGTPMAYVKSISHFKNENEMLLAAGTRYQVMSVEQTTGRFGNSYTKVRVRVVPS